MIVKSLELENYRNYRELKLEFESGVNILYGDNAQGKTNVLEALYMSATTRSHKGAKDKDIINFDAEEAHIKTILDRDGLERRVDMHLRRARSKGIAIDKVRLKKATELLGLLNIVFFSPEDLSIIKDAPSERRRFVDMELCQLDQIYLYDLNNYNKIVNQRNRLLKDMAFQPDLKDMIKIWDKQLLSYGCKLIKRRELFTKELNEIIGDIHDRLSAGRERLKVVYAPHVKEEEFEAKLSSSLERDIRLKMTGTGPHRDDFVFCINDIDARTFGSQGQQRTIALSLKLSEIEMVRKITKDNPVLLLDDVLSELDGKRQVQLLSSIGDIQTVITCTGLDDFVNNRFAYDKVFRVTNGSIESEN